MHNGRHLVKNLTEIGVTPTPPIFFVCGNSKDSVEYCTALLMFFLFLKPCFCNVLGCVVSAVGVKRDKVCTEAPTTHHWWDKVDIVMEIICEFGISPGKIYLTSILWNGDLGLRFMISRANKCPSKVKGQCQKSQSRINAIVGKNPSGKKQGLIYDLVATGQSVLSHCVCQLDQLHGEALRLLREWSPRGLRDCLHHQPH